jgi:hypothetical protein
MKKSSIQLQQEISDDKNLRPLPAREMHNIVLLMTGILLAIAATFPLSMHRVAQKGDGWGEKEKVTGSHLKTLDDAKQPIAQPLSSK